MKNFMFTAILLVAFGSVSLASTISDEENQPLLKEDPCETSAALAMAIFEEDYHNDQVSQGIPPDAIRCLDSYTYNRLYYAYLGDCK